MILLDALTNARCYTIDTKLSTHNPKSVAENILSIKRPESFEKMMHKHIHTNAESSGSFMRKAINSRLTFIRGHAKRLKPRMKKLDWLSLLTMNQMRVYSFVTRHAHHSWLLHSHSVSRISALPVILF